MAEDLLALTKKIRRYILTASSAAGSGHPTSSLSAVELMTVLFFKYLKNGDHVIFSKGHATPLFYALYTAAGKITEAELAKYRTFASNLEGHPSMRFPYTEVPTGSLGQGLAVAVGEALGQLIKKKKQNVFVLIGDGELAEGGVWEAASWAGHRKLKNLIAIVDINRLGQSEDTMLGYDVASYEKRFAAFGWRTVVVHDGNNTSDVDAALTKALVGGPSVILAKTVKGKGVSFLEGVNGWHGKALNKEELAKALYELRSK